MRPAVAQGPQGNTGATNIEDENIIIPPELKEEIKQIQKNTKKGEKV